MAKLGEANGDMRIYLYRVCLVTVARISHVFPDSMYIYTCIRENVITDFLLQFQIFDFCLLENNSYKLNVYMEFMRTDKSL